MRSKKILLLAGISLTAFAGCTGSGDVSEDDIKDSEVYQSLEEQLREVQERASQNESQVESLQQQIDALSTGTNHTVGVILSEVDIVMENSATSSEVTMSDPFLGNRGLSLEPSNPNAPVRETDNQFVELNFSLINENPDPVIIAGPVLVGRDGVGYLPLNASYLYIDDPAQFDPLGKAIPPGTPGQYKTLYEVPVDTGPYYVKHCGISGDFEQECAFLNIGGIEGESQNQGEEDEEESEEE